MTNKDLRELFDFIAGKGKFKLVGSAGFHTRPQVDDPRDKALHAACIELEKLGLIVRWIDKPDHVCWVEARTTDELKE